ncbi:MAG: hypothetical protein KKC03_13220 [Bacteroidetes bacterium]|nr:hypothetical protein [Bacteroidota bacterium]
MALTDEDLLKIAEVLAHVPKKPFYWRDLISPFLTILVIITGAVVYVSATSEKEAREESAPIQEKLVDIQVGIKDALDDLKDSVKEQRAEAKESTEKLEKKVDAVSRDVKAATARLREVEKGQAILKVVVGSRLTNTGEVP